MKSNSNPELSIILPCLNEEEAIGWCLDEINQVCRENSLSAEVVVVDNGSTDASATIVLEYQKKFSNIILVREARRGYGAAYLAGLGAARGHYFFLADADGTYDFAEIPTFINKLRQGAGLVVGNRFSGQMEKQAMPTLHRYLGNPVLSALVRLFFGVKIRDIHCGARALSRETLQAITLQTVGMEFASEMIIKIAKRHIQIAEVPIAYRKRLGDSKLKTFSDGWRHLRFMLLYAPNFLFLIPGLTLFLIGTLLTIVFYFTQPQFHGVQFYFYPMFLFAVMVIIGYQMLFFAGFSRVYAVTHFSDDDRLVETLFKKITIERAGIAGAIFLLIGLLIYTLIFYHWLASGFGSLNEIKNSIVALILIVLGIQTFFSAFILSMVGIREK